MITLLTRRSLEKSAALVVALFLAAAALPCAAAADDNSVAALSNSSELALEDGSLETAIAAAIRASDTAQRAALENELVAIALDVERSVEERVMACRLAALCGGGEALRLAPLLRDDELAHGARFALERLAGPEVDRVLLEAMTEVDGDLKLGLINSIAMRRAAEAVPGLVALASSSDGGYAAAAIRALGAIGTPRGLDALARLDVPSVLQNVRAEALLKAAQELIDVSPRNVAAVRAVEPLVEAGQPPSIRTAAFRLLVAAQPRRAVDRIANWIDNDDAVMRSAAAGALDLLPNRGAEASLVRSAATMTPAAQALLIGGLAARGSDVVLPLARQSLDAADEKLRRVAVQTVGRLGLAADVPVLLTIAAQTGEIGRTAIEALTRLPDKRVDAQLKREFAREHSPVRSQLPDVFVDRHMTGMLPDLWAVATDSKSDARLRTGCFRAIGNLAEADFVPTLFERLRTDDHDRTEIERALVAMGRRLADGIVVATLVANWGDENDEVRRSIVRMSGAIGDQAALEFLTPLAEADEPNEAAFRAVMSWTSEDALPVLDRWAGDEDFDDAQQEAIWRALFRVSNSYVRSDRTAGIPWLERSLTLATTVEDRRSVIEVLGNTPDDASLAVLARWDGDPELADAVAAARESINERTDRTPGR